MFLIKKAVFKPIDCKDSANRTQNQKKSKDFLLAFTALSFKNSSPYQKQHYFIARIRAGFSLVLHFYLLGLTD